MRTAARISLIVFASLLLNRPDALAQNERLLSGRYSFSAQGHRAPDQILPAGHVSRVGTVRLDGNGHVMAARFIETAEDGSKRAFGGARGQSAYYFVSGSYAVGENGLGRITLTFESIVDLDAAGSAKETLEETWDIGLTNDGRSFFLNAATSIAREFPGDTAGVSENQRAAINGEARAY